MPFMLLFLSSSFQAAASRYLSPLNGVGKLRLALCVPVALILLGALNSGAAQTNAATIGAATDSSNYRAATDSVPLTANNPTPEITSLSPAVGVSGGPAFVLTVNGSGFIAASTVYWGGVALVTQYVSGTQLTAQVTATGLTTAGAISVTVENPAPGGGGSDQFQFLSVTAGSAYVPSFQSLTATVTPEGTANYALTVPSSTKILAGSCYNAPVGVGCSYSAGVFSISTGAGTPVGTYQITTYFTEEASVPLPAMTLLPILLLPLMPIRRKWRARQLWLLICLGIAIASGTLATGCGIASSSNSISEVVTAAVPVSLTVQ